LIDIYLLDGLQARCGIPACSVFMSAEQFSQLSLEEAMVTTRAGAAKASRKETPPRQLDQDSPLPSVEPVSPVSPTPSLVISTNNLSYNVSSFDANHRRRVKRGLQDSGIRMKYCTTYVDDEDPEIRTQHFFINDDVQVAMGGRLRRPRCSCGANENGIACKVGLHASELHEPKANNS